VAVHFQGAGLALSASQDTRGVLRPRWSTFGRYNGRYDGRYDGYKRDNRVGIILIIVRIVDIIVGMLIILFNTHNSIYIYIIVGALCIIAYKIVGIVVGIIVGIIVGTICVIVAVIIGITVWV